ncbi:hypothetical protein EMIHUDRAFT_240437 [Emiliania huxleyi CCMP1516]|uniref:Major facilitator superfamily (MFS) profile domain-containing protein n=2 Tax=Emiliania huxleyi TaxID=2903 RepID=A0A0D3JFW7_EMIH1|nr:hypothetical protein EMIHUDRAFT_240437 [Emiliania huxleyi CCMP1516]EOD22402.1 hypothetical protein EMIHUDRAFT_240437 [Emiliania huxleyi CCMP1516]|eukprot:XP_005774831.1 hypothetical protein EMIHUDRAFT_240437 [Emiliania huxleyi CCMP1516]
MLGYADRTNLSVAVIAMSREFGWGEASTGTLLASFFCGYVLTQIPAGLAAARFGAKRVLLARVVVGLAEGVQIPCCNALLAAWVPLHGRARALSFIFSGQFVGTICALSCSPLAEWGWLGFVWCLVFAALAPASSPGASAGKGAAGEELGLISAVDGSGSPRCSASAPRCARPAFLAHPAFLAVCAAHFANNWGAYPLLSWLPNTPYAVAIVADNVGGWVADEVLLSRCRLRLLHARKSMQAVAMLVPCGCFLLLCGSTSAGGATALLAAAIAASSWSHAGYAANILDLAGGDAATTAQMWGVVNTVGTVPGIAANVVTGRVLAAAPTAAAGRGAEKAGSCGAGAVLGPNPKPATREESEVTRRIALSRDVPREARGIPHGRVFL